MAKTILLADDSVTIQKVVELTFMDEDYHVVATSDGQQALERLPEVAPDLVIADVHMPGADGYEVCRRTKETHPEIPVLLLVGTFEQFDEAKAVEVGADGHLKKPFDSQDLLSQVESLVGGSKAAPDLEIPSETSTAAIPLAGAAAAIGQPEEAQPSVGDLEPPPLGDLEPPPLGDLEPPPLDETAAPAEVEAGGDVFDLAPEPAAPVELEPPPLAMSPAGDPVPDFLAAGHPPAGEPAAAPDVLETAAVDLEAPSLEAPELDAAPPELAAEPEPVTEPEPEPEAAEPEPVTGPQPEPVADAQFRRRAGAVVEDFGAGRLENADEPAATEPEIAAEPAAEAESEAAAETAGPPAADAAGANGAGPLSDDDVERIAKRVAELVGEKALREVAWEVIPDLAEVIIKERIRELESQVE